MTHSSPAVPTPAFVQRRRTLWRMSVALSGAFATVIVTVAAAHGPTVETRMPLTRTAGCGAAVAVRFPTLTIARRSLTVGWRHAAAEAVRVRHRTTAPTTAVPPARRRLPPIAPRGL